MARMRRTTLSVGLALVSSLAGASASIAAAAPAAIQSASIQAVPGQAPAAGSRLAGTVTGVSGNVLTVKDDKGTESKVTVADDARVLQLPAGSKNLSSATAIKVSDIAVGDRILAKTAPDGAGLRASTVLAMKQADVAQKQQKDREDWQTRGISGVVKAVDAAASSISVSTGSGPSAKTVSITASKSTVIRRYAPDSTKFDDAKAATLDQIKVGDQLRAKGDKSADGTQFSAEDIVAGTFRNIAGTIVSVDPSSNTLTVTDLATKKPFTVTVNTESQMHKLPAMMAEGMARRLQGSGGGAPGARPGQEGPPAAAAGANAGAPPGRPMGGPGDNAGAQGGPGGPRGGGDLQQMLNRAPALQLSELKKGDAVMVLTTEGQTQGAATAITLLAGVEPLLQASPNASQSVLSASWNVSGGGAAGQDAQ